MKEENVTKRIALALPGDQLLALVTFLDSTRVVDVPDSIDIKALHEAFLNLRAITTVNGLL